MSLSHDSENPNESYNILFLMYGCEAVLPLEVRISSPLVALPTEMTDDEKHQLRLQELEALDDKCLQA